MVPPSSGRISRVPPYSSTAGHFLRPTGLSPALAGLSIPLRSISMPRNPSGLLPFRSPLLRESRLISFPPGTEMFQFPGLASPGLCIRPGDTRMRGLPHSEPPRSKTLCVSRGTFGAWPVLRRRLMPRHPPRAFLRLNPVSSDLARSCSLHEQLESTIRFLVLQVTLCLLLFRMLSPKFSICVPSLGRNLSLRPGAPSWS